MRNPEMEDDQPQSQVTGQEKGVAQRSCGRCNPVLGTENPREIGTGILPAEDIHIHPHPHPHQSILFIHHILELEQRTVLPSCPTSLPQLCAELLDGIWMGSSNSQLGGTVPRLLPGTTPVDWLPPAVPSDPSEVGWASTDSVGAPAFQCLFL